MANKQQDGIVQAAADWWVRLREPAADGELIEQWLAWTAEDARHLETFERLNELAERLGGLDRVSRQRLVKAFVHASPARRPWLPLAVAASIAILALSATVYFGWVRFAAGDTIERYQTAIAQNRDLVLPDGTKVALGAASSLSVHYSRGRRELELQRGEAFFQIVHDRHRPFVVHAGELTVRDIGTAFDIRRTGERVTIAVTQGRVAVADQHAGANQHNDMEASEGQRVSYDPVTSLMSVDNVAAAQATAWRSDRLEFVDEPLSVVIANLNRYSGKPLHIADTDLNALSYTGSIRVDAIDSWVKALPEVFPIKVSRENDRVILSDAKDGVHH